MPLSPNHSDPGIVFERARSRLFGIAYRMLGSRTDAEDMVQETYLRWHEAEHASIQSPEAWLKTVVTRLCVDRLRSAAAQREVYPGQWLPEPIQSEDSAPDRDVELSESLSMALLVILERLTPDERAAYLLHDAFGESYGEIARILGKSEAACRQIVHRARERVRRDRPRFQVAPEDHQRLVEEFKSALVSADADALMSLLSEEAVWSADGGGRVPAAPQSITGRSRIVQLLMGLLRKQGAALRYAVTTINGQPGLLVIDGGQLAASISFETDGAAILAAYAVVNPDKLRGIRVPPAEGMPS